MAHNVESMAYAGEVPWHGLGRPVSNDLTSYEMLEAAGLNWKVERAQNHIFWDGKYRPTGDYKLVRSTDGKVLTNISEGWNEVQNHEAADFFYDFVMEGDMEMHTAGSLKGGEIVWFLAKVKDEFKVNGKDVIESNLLFTLPHQYGKATDVRFTPIRVVCNNTLTLALSIKGEHVVRINHTKKFDPDVVKETLGLTHSKMVEYKEMAEFLASRKAKKDDITRYLQTVFPAPANSVKVAENENYMSRPATTIMSLMDTQPGAEFGEGTWWQPFNAVTYAIDHKLGQKADTRLHSAWYGPNRQRKINALKAAVEFAEAA